MRQAGNDGNSARSADGVTTVTDDGDRYDAARVGVEENVTTSSGCAGTLADGDGRVMNAGSSGVDRDADGVQPPRMIEIPSAGVGVKIDGSINDDSDIGATICG